MYVILKQWTGEDKEIINQICYLHLKDRDEARSIFHLRKSQETPGMMFVLCVIPEDISVCFWCGMHFETDLPLC